MEQDNILYDAALNVKEIQLERIKIGLMQRISNHLLGASVLFSEQDSFIYNSVDMRIRGYIWGERGKSEAIKYPATWRDSFKERWFPKWLLARYPVAYRVHEINTTTLYPNFRISVPDQTHVLKYQVLSRIERAS
jgi:hypothetical protein